jgi:hypothetical protein
LIGVTVSERRTGRARGRHRPRQHVINSEGRSFARLRPVADASGPDASVSSCSACAEHETGYDCVPWPHGPCRSRMRRGAIRETDARGEAF